MKAKHINKLRKEVANMGMYSVVESEGLFGNFPFKCEIDKVIIIQDYREISIQYRVVGYKYFFEADLFPTKEELLKSL